MQQQIHHPWLYGPDGHLRQWTVEVKPHKHDGETFYDERLIILGSHLRSPRTIAGTIIHEAGGHAVWGPNIHEEGVLSSEYNSMKLLKLLGII